MHAQRINKKNIACYLLSIFFFGMETKAYPCYRVSSGTEDKSNELLGNFVSLFFSLIFEKPFEHNECSSLTQRNPITLSLVKNLVVFKALKSLFTAVATVAAPYYNLQLTGALYFFFFLNKHAVHHFEAGEFFT